MNNSASLICGLALGTAAVFGLTSAAAASRPPLSYLSLSANAANQGRNTISVNVFGSSRRPLTDIYVELLNDVYSTIDRQKTTGAGRAVFNNLPDGTYKVRVLPYGTEYMEQTKDVTIINYSITGTGSQNEQVDMYLKVREGFASGPFAAPPGVIFAQDVPETAKRFYDRGVIELRENKEKDGFESLRKAIEIFPTYYAALERLGTEYVMRGTPAHYEAARALLMKAVEVNSRGFPSTFGLGLAQYKLKQTNEAIDNLRRATTIHNQSVDAHLYLGMALSQAGKTAEAEAIFKRANAIGKGKAAEVHFQMARLYSAQNRYVEAADALELYLKNKPDTPDADKMKLTIQQLREKAAKK
jgi:tetratricopeptide (TPR) repeat protein